MWSDLKYQRTRLTYNIEWPKKEEVTSYDLKVARERLDDFITTCVLALAMVDNHLPGLSNLQAEVIWQYYLLVVRGFQDSFYKSNKSKNDSDLEQAFCARNYALDKQAFEIQRDWILMSPFRPVIAALQKSRKPGESMEDTCKRLAEAHAWYSKANKFLPVMFLIDTKNFVIGETVPYWPLFPKDNSGAQCVNKWQDKIRLQSFLNKDRYQAALEALQDVKAGEATEMIEKGWEKVQELGLAPFFTDVCVLSECEWTAINRRLRHEDQCNTCRCLFQQTKQRNESRPSGGFPSRDGRWWSCAEVDAHNQLVLWEQGKANGRDGINDGSRGPDEHEDDNNSRKKKGAEKHTRSRKRDGVDWVGACEQHLSDGGLRR
jgi:hypothetical protein